jgi:DNA-binding FadR family transcriptional regulator
LTGGVVLAALLSAGWLWNRRRALAAVLLPYEIALARLQEARALMQPENAREFSIAVSEIVRHYIEVRFQVLAARRTTEEFLHDLLEPSDALLTSHREMLADFLHHCDLAKFARWILSIKEMDTMLQSAHAFVLETGRPPTPETNSAAAQSGPERAPVVVEPAHATS